MLSMGFYVVIFCIFGFFSIVEVFLCVKPPLKRLMEFIALGLAIFLSSIRYSPAGDYLTYRFCFEEIQGTFWDSYLHANTHELELGYYLLNYIVKKLWDNYQFFVFVEAVITNLILYLASKSLFRKDREAMSQKDFTVTIFFIEWSLGLYNIIIIRQTIAVMLCLYSIRYIRGKNWFRFLLVVAVATLFHRTSCVWLPAYVIYHRRADKIKMRFGYLMCFIAGIGILVILLQRIGPFLPGIFGRKVSYYLSQGLSTTHGSLYSVFFTTVKSSVNIAALFIVFCFLLPRFKNDRMYVGLYNLYLAGAAIMVATFFLNSALTRAATCYNSVSAFLLTYLFRFVNLEKGKALVFAVFTVYLFLRMYVYIHSSGYLMSGYETIWGVI